jgi:hypothetical protein
MKGGKYVIPDDQGSETRGNTAYVDDLSITNIPLLSRIRRSSGEVNTTCHHDHHKKLGT